MPSHSTRFSRLAVVAAALALISVVPANVSLVTRAHAAAQVSVEFRSALQPYGRWERSRSWGDVWIPQHVSHGWRPYTVGHWVYTDDYGWYWITDEREADWGWVVYHYGRWVLDADLGWVWIPGREWAPAWVSWRRGHDHVGWAPLPPDRVIVEYRDRPDVWMFVRARSFTAPNIARVLLPFDEQRVYVRRTVIVNRTVVGDRRGPAFAVNPGITPAVVAAISGKPLRTYRVRPRVIAGTAQIPNAVQVEARELQKGKRQQVRVSAEETSATIRPAKNVPEPRALSANENGRLGDDPPKAARSVQRPADDKGKAAQQQEKGTEATGKAAEKAGQPDNKASEKSSGKAAGKDKADETQRKAAEDKAKPGAAKGKAATENQEPAAKGRAAEKSKADREKAAESKGRSKKAGEKNPGEGKADRGKGAAQKGAAQSSESTVRGAEKAPSRPSRGSAAERRQAVPSRTEGRGGAGPAASPPSSGSNSRPSPARVQPQTDGRGPAATTGGAARGGGGSAPKAGGGDADSVPQAGGGGRRGRSDQ